MEKAWRDDQLVRINNGTSIFAHIPAEIGRVIYCDSTNGKAEGKVTIETRQIILVLCGVLLAALSTFAFMNGGHPAAYIFLGLLAAFSLFMGLRKLRFRGTDYFVGEKGFAIVSFERDRRAIKNMLVRLYDDIAFLRVSEERESIKTRHTPRQYTKTICYLTFYGFDPANSMAIQLDKFTCSFRDKSARYSMPMNADTVCQFMKTIEAVWTKRFLSMQHAAGAISFPKIDRKGNLRQCVDVYPWGMRVFDEYNRLIDFKFEEIKDVKFVNDDELVIEHANHSSRWLGLVEDGITATIDYSRLANGRALLTLIWDRANAIDINNIDFIN